MFQILHHQLLFWIHSFKSGWPLLFVRWQCQDGKRVSGIQLGDGVMKETVSLDWCRTLGNIAWCLQGGGHRRGVVEGGRWGGAGDPSPEVGGGVDWGGGRAGDGGEQKGRKDRSREWEAGRNAGRFYGRNFRSTGSEGESGERWFVRNKPEPHQERSCLLRWWMWHLRSKK